MGENKMYTAGIVGCGSIAGTHSQVLSKMEHVVVKGLADIRPERAKALGEKVFAGKPEVFSSLEEMVEAIHPDVVHICTPHYLHVPMAVWLLEHGVNVFMEKPAAINREQFAQLEAAVKASSARLGICFQNRYNDSSREIDRLLAEGELGKVVSARGLVTWCRGEKYYTESGWRGALATEGGGALINQGIHTLDLLVRWMGKPQGVEASMSNRHLKGIIEVEDTLDAYIQFPNGNALFYTTTAYGADSPVIMELVCENGSIHLEDNKVKCSYKDGRETNFEYGKNTPIGKSYWGAGHTACINDYYHCLTENIPFENEFESVRDTMNLMFDIYESAGQGK